MLSSILTPERAFAAAIGSKILSWEPSLKGLPRPRILALEKAVHAQLSTPWGDGESDVEVLRQEVLAVCDRFIAGSTSLRLLFKEIGGRNGVAEMLILAPDPGVRILGGFLSDTVFVGTSIWLRNELPFKHNPSQTQAAKIDWKTLNLATAKLLNDLLGPVKLHRTLQSKK